MATALMELAIAPVRLERSRTFDLVTIPSFFRLSLIGQELKKIAQQATGRPDTLLISGPTKSIKSSFYKLHWYYQTVAYEKTPPTVLGRLFQVEKGLEGDIYLYENALTTWLKEPWVAIAYGDSIAEASNNYLQVFAAEHYPWWKIHSINPNPFDPGWKVSVSSVFVPQDADFNPAQEMRDIEHLSNGYAAKLWPLSLINRQVATTTIEKQLLDIYKNPWKGEIPLSQLEKLKRHQLVIWGEESLLIQQEKNGQTHLHRSSQ